MLQNSAAMLFENPAARHGTSTQVLKYCQHAEILSMGGRLSVRPTTSAIEPAMEPFCHDFKFRTAVPRIRLCETATKATTTLEAISNEGVEPKNCGARLSVCAARSAKPLFATSLPGSHSASGL